MSEWIQWEEREAVVREQRRMLYFAIAFAVLSLIGNAIGLYWLLHEGHQIVCIVR